MKIEASFVRSAADAGDLPRDGAPEIALVGRSNVGKSSVINALVGRPLARTSAAPGKTRLANVYRVRTAGPPFYLVDLPGFGFARGNREELEAVVREYFGRTGAPIVSLFFVDARHPGLQADIEAWRWLQQTVARRAIVATKIDKLARGERIRALRELESVHETSVLPISAVTGEGLDELWKLIDRLRASNRPPRPPSNSSNQPPPKGTGTPARRRPRSWSSRRSRT